MSSYHELNFYENQKNLEIILSFATSCATLGKTLHFSEPVFSF